MNQTSVTQPFNPLTLNIHIQILLTGLYTFPKRISKENLIKDKCIFPQMIIVTILTMGIALKLKNLAQLFQVSIHGPSLETVATDDRKQFRCLNKV